MLRRLLLWSKTHLPTRESLATNRWTKPFARSLLRPDLWRLNRRSVPMGVAVGLLTGPIIPVAHTGLAAIVAIPARGNIVVAVVTTWLISNPFTWIPLYASAGRVGTSLFGTSDKGGIVAFKRAWNLGWPETFSALLHEGKVIAVGVLVLSVAMAVAGYLLTSLVWRIWIGRKWRARGHGPA